MFSLRTGFAPQLNANKIYTLPKIVKTKQGYSKSMCLIQARHKQTVSPTEKNSIKKTGDSNNF